MRKTLVLLPLLALAVPLAAAAGTHAGEGTVSVEAGRGKVAIEMVGGIAVGVAGAALLLPLMRRVSLPSPALYPLRMLAAP